MNRDIKRILISLIGIPIGLIMWPIGIFLTEVFQIQIAFAVGFSLGLIGILIAVGIHTTWENYIIQGISLIIPVVGFTMVLIVTFVIVPPLL